MKIHKLKFSNEAEWQTLKDAYKGDARIKATAYPFETGIIPNPVEFDEEGNALDQTFIEGFHVDVMVTEVIQEWKTYTVIGITHEAHQFGFGEVVTDSDFI
jgi:hypothetical protein